MLYSVQVKEVHVAVFEVEADSREQALQNAEDAHNDEPGELFYLETLGKDQWSVEEKGGDK